MIIFSYLFRALRWRYLIASIKDVKTANLFSPLMIGSMGNMLPARAGEFIRAYLLGKRESISFTSSFATIFIERLFDLFFVLLLLLVVLLLFSNILTQGPSGENNELMNFMIKFGWISFTLCLFILLFSAILQYKNDLAMKAVNFFLRPFPRKFRERVIGSVISFTEGVKIIKDKRRFSTAMATSFLIYVFIIFTFYFLYLAFDINTQLPVVSSLLILLLTVDVFVAVFPTPGFLGSFHAACVASLHGIFGLPKAIALSYGIVAWLIMMGFTVLAGTLFAVKDNISWRDLSSHREINQ